jgi:hypothetical protein
MRSVTARLVPPLVVAFTAVLTAGGLGVSARAVGVKETARLTVSGAALAQPIELIDPAVLELSNVFAGTFIGTPTIEPDATWPRYTVAFDIQTLDGVKLNAYVVIYSRNRWTGEGFVYLPGRGDDSFRRNISTILRDGQDGRWHHASPAWSAAMNARLP